MFYDPDRATTHRHRNLPHWQQSGVIAFLTFRLADSIPRNAMADWDRERRIWLLHRLPSAAGDLESILPQLSDEDRRIYLRRFGKQFHDFLDAGHGSCLLRSPEHSAIVESAILHFDTHRYRLGDYVIMPNHVHALIEPLGEHAIGAIAGSWKRFSAREMNKRRGTDGPVWQHESFDHQVRHAGAFEEFRRYIRENPKSLRAGEFRLGCGSMK